MRIHNRYLPQCVHRIANGVMTSLFLACAGAFGAGHLACDSFLGTACLALLCTSPLGLLASCATRQILPGEELQGKTDTTSWKKTNTTSWGNACSMTRLAGSMRPGRSP